MQQEPMSLLEFQNRFPDEESCREHLFRIRWPEGYSCPRCGHKEYGLITTRHLYQCRSCNYQASVTSGTVFHKTRTSLRKWFWMIMLMSRQKSGVSMLGMQQMLEIGSYKTAWLMGHKIRKAMADRDAHYQLAGLVEMDDYFIGPKKEGKRGRGAEGKSKVLVSVESRGLKAGFSSMTHVPAVSRNEILSAARTTIEPGSHIRTDGWRAYRVLGEEGFAHSYVILMKDKKGLEQLKWVHTLIANIKGNIRGVYHGVAEKHLKRYLGEFCYRFNRRLWAPQLFDRALCACTATSTITFTDLTK
jgi:transposase-like protein